MKIGTVETEIITKRKKRKRRSSSYRSGRGSTGNGGGGGDDGSGGGDDSGANQREAMPEETNPEKSRILTWFLLLVVLMTFGGLIGAYVVVSTNRALEWQPFSLPTQVWVSTAIIIASSFTYSLGKKRLTSGRSIAARNWLLATTALGASFISSQILAWMALVERGLYMRGNPYAGFFYVLTAVHAAHVTGGIAALGYILIRVWKNDRLPEPEREKSRTEARYIGWYWHTMDGLWLVLLFLLGFWK